jgi:prepilin-type processing-associated H-X9-DG protein
LAGKYATNGAFGSEHPGGALFAYGDGHVEFLSDGIADELYQAGATIACSDDRFACHQSYPGQGKEAKVNERR